MRSWWRNYRCLPSSLRTDISLFGLNAGYCATPVHDGFLALAQALDVTGYDASKVWVPRPCPTGISGKTCQSDGTNCSLHNYGIAVDIDPYGLGNDHFQRPYGEGWDFHNCKFDRLHVEAVEAIKNTNGDQYFRWLGWAIGDTMHFELQVPPSITQVDWNTVPGGSEMPQLPLEHGMESEDVRSLQDRLNRAYNSRLTEDAVYGNATATAIAASPMPTYTGDTSSAIQAGKRVNANMWNGLFEDWVRKIAGSGGGGLTQTKADTLYQPKGVIPSHGHKYAKLDHSHKGTVTEKTEVTLT